METAELSLSETSAAVLPACGCRGASAAPAATADAPPAYVYALGRIQMRFPSQGVEKEVTQATARADTAGLTDRQALHAVLTRRENRYLVRQICWVLTIEGLEAYLLIPRNEVDYDLLLEAVRSEPGPTDVDVVVGVRGPIAPPEACGGLAVPILVFDQIWSFDRNALIGAIPRPASVPEEQDKAFRAAAEELFDRIQELADNTGATPEQRALNYLAVRYPALYATAADAFARSFSLAGVDVRPSRLSGARQIVDVILSFANRQTDVTEKSFVRVDVTEEFPFLVTKITPYYDR